MKLGKLIVIDGGEGTGKTSLSSFLKDDLPASRFVFTREPGGTPMAESIRTIILSKDAKESSPETMFHLFWAARLEHLNRIVLPALTQGKHVICDRFDSSTYAYQICAQDGGKKLYKLFNICRDLLPIKPAHYIILDVDPKVSLARVEKRAGEKTHFDARRLEFHTKVRAGMKDFVKNKPHTIINAVKSIEVVRKDALRLIKKIAI